MRAPAFYPDRPSRVELVESHISWVFLAGDRAYKLRKPVVFPFLDYGTAERRHAMCEEEIRLGRRLAPDLYLGVRPLTETADGWELGRSGDDGAEHVVEMRRFDPSKTLAAVLSSDDADEATVRLVARLIAQFHKSAPQAPEGRFDPEAVAATVSENFSTLLPFAPLFGEPELAGAQLFAVAFLHARRRLLEERVARGFVRDCHGDLRAEHVILEPGSVQVFDPVEFDPALRQIDVCAELAFLVMDMIDLGAESLAEALVDEYGAAGGDYGGPELLFFYAAYRAWVRAKVACLLAGELPQGEERTVPVAEAHRLARLARRLAWRARGEVVLVICGGAATGKTVLAQAICELSGLPHLSSDIVRKELAGLEPGERAPAELYTEEDSVRTYRELGTRAAAARGAVVDATFRRRSHRAAFSEAFGGTALFVECRAPANVVAQRARSREHNPGRVSDATEAIAAAQATEFEPLDEVPAARHLLIRTDRPLDRIVLDLEAALDRRAAPARE
jgi:aminoglycoside phosphotransferase family enzyme/predicted kinase